MVDPVTFKVFTDNTHIVALKNTGNVFTFDTVERLNIKAKNWRDLVSEDEFSRKDIIVLQDPKNIESRNLSSFKYLRDGTSTLTPEQQAERSDPTRNVNASALGNGASVLKTRSEKAAPDINPDALSANRDSIASTLKSLSQSKSNDGSAAPSSVILDSSKSSANAPKARHTTGQAAASLTSTGLTPHTSASLATLTKEEYLLRPRLVKHPGYVRIETTFGPLGVELYPMHAPKAVWNFIQLAKQGYYNGVGFHRSIRNFMLQGGDPTGTGKGGKSCWAKYFEDEFDGPLGHSERGVMSMANKGKNTNTSQFFITYRACKHLDRKHTVFGKVVEGADTTLSRIEAVPTGEADRPKEEVLMKEVVLVVDPFEEFLEKEKEGREKEEVEREIKRQGGRDEDKVTWTGKRIRTGDGRGANGDEGGGAVGKYLKAATTKLGEDTSNTKETQEEWEGAEEPRKKIKVGGGGYGNFDNW